MWWLNVLSFSFLLNVEPKWQHLLICFVAKRTSVVVIITSFPTRIAQIPNAMFRIPNRKSFYHLILNFSSWFFQWLSETLFVSVHFMFLISAHKSTILSLIYYHCDSFSVYQKKKNIVIARWSNASWFFFYFFFFIWYLNKDPTDEPFGPLKVSTMQYCNTYPRRWYSLL